MEKYIDIDRLRKEIDHRIDILEDMSIKCAKNNDTEMHAYYHGKALSLDELLLFIDSLQKEQGLIVINKKDWEAQEQFRKNKDFGKPLQQEQPDEVDFDKELDSFYDSPLLEGETVSFMSYTRIAKHFYELGQLEMRHRITNPEYNEKVVEQLKSEYPAIKEEK